MQVLKTQQIPWFGTDSTNPYPNDGVTSASPAEIFYAQFLKEAGASGKRMLN